MNLFLQIWGGSFYLSNKILLAIAESRPKKSKRLFRLAGWLLYILGVPAWVIILISQQNWIAASIEVGGVPSMLLGLYNVYEKEEISSKRFDIIARSVAYVSLALGLGYSIHENGGINSVTQLLELVIMTGFLLGSYFLARNNSSGWLFFMLTNGSMAILMFIQNAPILLIQQIFSLFFVCYGYTLAIKSNKNANNAIKRTENTSVF